MKYLGIIFFLLSSCSGFKVVNESGACVKWYAQDDLGHWVEVPCPDPYEKRTLDGYEVFNSSSPPHLQSGK